MVKDLIGGAGKIMMGESVNKKEIFVVLVTYVVIFLLILLFGKYLWNEVLIKLIPGIKPVSSVWQVLGISILVSILKM